MSYSLLLLRPYLAAWLPDDYGAPSQSPNNIHSLHSSLSTTQCLLTAPDNPLNAASSCDSACVCYVTERDAMIYVAHPGLARPDPLDAPYSTLIASLAYISSLLPPAASCLCANPARAIAAVALPRCAARCLEASTL